MVNIKNIYSNSAIYDWDAGWTPGEFSELECRIADEEMEDDYQMLPV